MQNEIFRCDVSFIFVRGLRKGRRARRTREFVYFKVEIVEMPGARPSFVALPSYLCPHDVIGQPRVWGGSTLDAHARRPSHSCYSFQLPLLCSGRLKVLSVFTRAKTSSQGYLYCFICPPRFLSLPPPPPPPPPRLRTFTQSFIGFTQLQTRRSFSLFSSFLSGRPREMSSSAPHVVCLIVGAFVWGARKEWGHLFTQMV